MAIKAVLIDDEYTSSEVLDYEIKKLNFDIEVVAMFEDPVEGLKHIKSHVPDILFLDIEMPRLNGFELLDLLGNDHDIKIIFVTAYNQYAVNAFEYFAVDYLVKPVSSERLSEALKKAINNPRKITHDQLSEINDIVNNEIDFAKRIVIPIQNGYQVIETNDIIRCESDNNYTYLYLHSGDKVLVSKSLKHFENILKGSGFIRVHQSHLINISYMSQYIKSDGGFISMKDGFNAPVSRSQKQAIIDLLKSKSV